MKPLIRSSLVIPFHNKADHLKESFHGFWLGYQELQPKAAEIHLMENGNR